VVVVTGGTVGPVEVVVVVVVTVVVDVLGGRVGGG
jgi:hypothetical protein